MIDHASPWKRVWRRRRELLGDTHGATAVEFALLAPMFFFVIAAILQTSVIFLASQVLESAVQDASREVRTGQMHQGNGSVESFRTSVCDRLYGLFADCDGLHVRVVSDDRFDNLQVEVPVNMDCQNPCSWTADQVFIPGGGEKVVLVQVFYQYPVVIPLGPVGMANLGDGSRLMGSSTVFKNEPFLW